MNENLIPFTSEQSREKAKENGRKGGIKSGESKRASKTFAEIARMINKLPVNEKVMKQMKDMGVDENDISYNVAIILAQYQRASKGDHKAYKNVQELNEGDKKLALERERFEKEMEMKERDYQMRLRDIELREKEFAHKVALGNGEVEKDDKVIIVNDLDEYDTTERADNSKVLQDVQQ